MSRDTAPTVIDEFLIAITESAIPEGIFTAGAVLDATVPNWRFSVHGAGAVRTEFSRWYADPGRFQAVQRTPLPDGERVEFTLTWTEEGVEHTCHQAHIVAIEDGLISSDTVFCGGRWPASLVAEMNA